jgi:hypothetical protein
MMKNSMMKTATKWTPLALIIAGTLVTGVLVRGQGAAMGDAVLQPPSKPFGTTIAIENGVGVIRVTPASTQ